MLGRLLGGGVALDLLLDPGTSNVMVDPSQLEQVLVNLILNARDALPRGGRVTISTRNAADVLDGEGGESEYVILSVIDTGTGMDPETQAHIFEPFFTTKQIGQGTGLGLSQVFGFAKQSGGEVRVESEPGRGTSFTLYLPQVAAPTRVEERQKEEDAAPRPVKGRVLVVEDNAHVGEFATQLLVDLGYETLLAPDGQVALELISRGEHVDVMFTDVVMPGMSGIDLAKEFCRRRPGVPVVLASGYSHIVTEEGTHGFPLLRKPYSMDGLSNAMRLALSA
jgi:CheY-like chemotaxis protein